MGIVALAEAPIRYCKTGLKATEAQGLPPDFSVFKNDLLNFMRTVDSSMSTNGPHRGREVERRRTSESAAQDEWRQSSS